MTEPNEEILASMSLSKILVAILETVGEVTVSTLSLIDAANEDKGLIVEYDETGPSFTFKLKDNDENGNAN